MRPFFSGNASGERKRYREIADAVCYLAGPHGGFVIGTDLAVDGGFLTGMPGIVARTIA